MSENAGNRYGFIDAIRGIAACLVVIQHALYLSGIIGDPEHGPLTGFIPNFLELGETGVVAFFLVSGFVIPLSLEKTANVRMFWLHRILRIYPLYLFVYIVSLVVQAGDGLHGPQAYMSNLLAHLLMIQEYVKQPNFVGGSWTLSIEMVWYVGLSVLFLASINKKTNVLVGLGVIVSIVAQAICAYGVHVPMGRLSMLLCCIMGLICYRRSKNELSLRHFISLALVLGTTIASNLAIGLLIYPDAHPTATFVTARNSWMLASIIFFVPFISRHTEIWQHSILAYVGRISYSIYLVHAVILYLLKQTELSGIPFLLTAFVLTFIVASVTYRFIETPPIRFGHRIKLS